MITQFVYTADGWWLLQAEIKKKEDGKYESSLKPGVDCPIGCPPPPPPCTPLCVNIDWLPLPEWRFNVWLSVLAMNASLLEPWPTRIQPFLLESRWLLPDISLFLFSSKNWTATAQKLFSNWIICPWNATTSSYKIRSLLEQLDCNMKGQ